ncbi:MULTISPECIES: non-ribosomal peptide synthetase [unclassified Gordonia (in: high G+C Gram-positive bacteria)]|uniref:non-ribosomal peptide synthetase n=1 Tax=unclassified Gordonia (in: high G+C Gram-positive bacteria) TaxID=2657482 RepID=UPI00071CEC20|nr:MULTISPECIES: non-ribosomal peptide synthetase [unclassified Gordonia (in: high G+C Gram-positive bacteria)]KSU58247.1 hypothetical protein AS181_12245 [Gordonia sp. SGD-V-85]SCC28129.1 non-ribosomal peptide synthase domain TIGR01720/amino acid adenylation domain-containing protein [Gordonia sp. v-85]
MTSDTSIPRTSTGPAQPSLRRPSALRLLALAAAHAGDDEAMSGAAGPVTFRALHRRVSASAITLAERGVAPDAALRATVTALMPRAGLSGSQLATAAAGIVDELDRRITEILGLGDRESLPGLFRIAARRRADAVALADLDGASLTYRELDERSERMAHALVDRGAGPETLVGVALPRSVDLIVALLAVLKTGAAYLPLDRTHPVARLRGIVEDASPVAVVADAETVGAWAAMPAPLCTPQDLLAQYDIDARSVSTPPLPEHVTAQSSAYVMYTSGSTGRPKGVVVTHDNVVSLLDALDAVVESSPDDVWSMFHSYAFDVSVGEIWAALRAGGRLLVLDHATTRAPDDVVEAFDRHGVTIVNFTPSSFYQFAAVVRPPLGRRLPDSVRRLHFSGELLDYEHVRTWQTDRAADGSATRPGADVAGPQLNNMYGPTETTVYMTRRELTRAFVDRATASDIGTPLLGSRVYVLDGRLAPVPDGVPGELYVAGAQVTRGFLNRHGQTSTRYVADPFGPPGGRMYRTGDVGMSRNGSIEFVGRRDGQVKLRGFRIELGEVESAMSALDGVDAAGADIRTLGDTEHLVGYLVAAGGAASAADDAVGLSDSEIRTRLATAVPEYMVPTRFVRLPRLPLTVNGKLDRGALPDPGSGDGPEAEPPAGATEAALAALVAEILGVSDVGVTTSLFDLGGNSLTATRVAARAAEHFGTTVSAREVFADPTVRGLGAVIDGRDPGDHDGSGGADRRVPLRRVGRDGVLPLSPAQRRIWFLETLDPGGAGYLIPAVLRLDAASGSGQEAADDRSPDPAVVAAALADLLARHEVLRTRFVSVDGVPEQVIAPAGDPRHDVRVTPPIDMRGAGEGDVTATIAEITSRGFDLEAGAPVRARLIRVADDAVILVLVVHHIISDGASVAPMVTDFVTAYEARAAGREPSWAPLPVQYVDYSVWQHLRLGDAADPTSLAARQLDHWRTRLAGVPALIELPVDRPRTAVRDDSGAELSATFDAATWNALGDLAGRHGATMFMAVHALLAVTLVRSGADEDVVIGTPVAGRGERDLDPLIGMFVNTLALRSRVRRAASFTDLLDDIREIDVTALDHADLPFETVVDEVVAVRDTAHPPLVQVALAFQNAARPTVELPGLVVSEIEAPVTTAKVDLQITVLDEPGRSPADDTRVIVTYATALFDAGTVDAFVRRMTAIARAVVDEPHTPVGDLSTGDDHLDAVIAAPGLASARSTLADLLDAAIAVNPDGIAVTENGQHLTYTELDLRTRRLADVLRARGAGPDAVIALATPRSLEGTVGFWAIARTGAAVAPVDPGVPGERLRYMLDTVDARLGVTSSEVVAGLRPAAAAVDWVVAEQPGDPDETGVASARRPRPDETAYVIFTSGSTGRPKGVAVTHRGLADLIADARARFGLTPAARVLRFAAPGFDAAVFETLVAVAAASTMVVVPGGVTGGTELAAILRRERITHATITPTALATVSEAVTESGAATGTGFPDLEVISVAGDVCSPELVRAWSAGRSMHNLYGPTETTIWATSSAPMRPDSAVTIGGPIAGATAAVLDPRLHPVPAGVAGELYLAGSALAAGYVGRTALTAERFVAAPFGAPGERMYRTGDLVRWRRRSGRWTLDFLGRSDFQVKIRGFRIELGEIDAVLGEHPGVDFSTTAGIEHPTSGETVLVSWVHGVAGAAPDTADVATHAARRLPAHMVPTVIVPIDDIPLTATGKLDSRALPTPRFGAHVHVRPSTATEQAVAAVYAEVLGLDAAEEVSAEASFFDLGGTSLSATRVVARLGGSLGVEIGVRALFETPTVRALAAAVDAGEHGRGADLPTLEAIRRPDPVPVSYAQRRMWFLNQFDPHSAAYVIPIVVRLRGDLHVSAMRAAILDVVDRHEVLRTIYPTTTPDGDTGAESIAAGSASAETGARAVGVEPVAHAPTDWAGRIKIGHTVVPPRAAASSDQVVDQEIQELVTTTFDVTTDLPVRVRIITASADHHVLVIALHHIAADGESAPVLAAEIARAYAARRSGRAPDWPALRFQYADYAVWQRHRLGDPADADSLIARQLRFWVERLTGLPDILPLPIDRPRPAESDGRAATVRWSLPAAVVSRLRRRAAARRATLFMVAHTATAAVLARLTSTNRIAVATPVAGRGRREIDQLIGMFVNTVILSVDVEPHVTVGALLEQVKNADLAAFDNADVPFERVIDAVNPQRIENVEPLAQVLLVHSTSGRPALGTLAGLDTEFVEIEDTAAKFDLTIGFRETADGGLTGSIAYATALFDPATAEMISAALSATLSSLADDADLPVDDVPILTAAEADAQQQLSVGPAVVLPALTIPAAITAASQLRLPEAVAVRFGDRTLTQREFAARVATLARELIALGIGPEDCVAVCMPRSIELVIAVHAVLAAGGQYMPVAPDAPSDRVRHMVDTAHARIALICDDRAPAAQVVARAIVVDAANPVDLDTVPVAADERLSILRPDHAAYTIFTSGSTGRPKGVTVSHRAVLNRLRWGVDEFGIGPHDSILLKTPFTFDVSVPELLTPALTGARLVIAPDDAHLDPHSMARLIDAEQITTVHFVPSLLAVFIDEIRPVRSAPDAGDIRPARSAPGACDIRPARSAPGAGDIRDDASSPLPSLRHLYCSGEALPPATLRATRAALPRVRVSNLFGPTEAAVEVAVATPDPGADVVPIGRPVWNTQTFVFDARLRPVPAGVTGELYLGGVQLARGYAARPDLTAERFVADPAGGGRRLYRTGDLVRRNRAGDLEYLGRRDFQVKLRGQRIELGEIEAVLSDIDGVRQAVVTVASAPGGSDHLVGYLIGPGGGGPDGDEFIARAREAVTASLPVYMRPTLWVPLTEAPLGSTGKLDRKSLPAPRFDPLSEAVHADAAPADDAERTVAAIVASLLGVEDVPVTRSFFELGGDSIASIRLASMLRAAGLHLTPRDVFAASTIRELARRAQTEAIQKLDEIPGGAVGPVGMTPGLAWMLDLADDPDDLADFSQSTVLALPVEADEAAVRAVVTAVVAAHPMLTASLRTDSVGGPVVVAGDGDPGDITVEILDRSDISTSSRPSTPARSVDSAIRAAHARALATLSPADGRLVAAIGVRFADGTGRLVVAAHHLGVDAVSWPTIVAGLGRAWWQYRNGETPGLAASGTSFRRWSGVLAGLAGRAEEIEWWSRQLPPTPAEWEIDRARDRLATTISVSRTVGAGLAERVLGTVTETFGARPDTVVAAAVAFALRDPVTASGPVSMVIENHGREEGIAPGADLTETVGWFTSFVPVSVDVPGPVEATAPAARGEAAAEATPGHRLATMVKALKDTQSRMPDNGIAFGPLRWLRPGSPLRNRPLPPITVNYLGLLGGGGIDDTDSTATDFVPIGDAPPLPPSVRGDMIALAALTVTAASVATAGGRELRVDLTAPEGLFDEPALGGIADRWESALSSLAAYVDAVGDPGPSETDVIGGLDQTDIDHVLATRTRAARTRGRYAIWPPTPLQQGLFYEAQRLVGVDPYVTQSVIEFDGAHPADMLLPAVRELLTRQRVLRSGFTRTPSGRLVVVVPPADHPAVTEPDFRGVDLTGLSTADAASRIVQIADEDLRRPFVLDDPPLIRFSAVSHDTVTGPACTLVITAHHIILDGWSGPILVADLLAAHLGRPAITPARDFESYLDWLDRRDAATTITAWREHLADIVPTLVRPQVHPGADREPRRHEVTARVSATTRAALERTVRTLGTTTSTVLNAAWSIVLSRFTGEQRVVFGETVSGRPADLDGADGMIGLFINTVPVVADVAPGRSLAALIGELHHARARMLDHQFVGLGDITAATGHPRLFDTLVVFESYPVDVDTVVAGSRTSGLEIRDVSTSDATHYPLALIAAPEGDDLCLTVKTDLSVVGEGVAETVAAMLTDLLDAVIDDPSLPVAALDPMPTALRPTVEGWSRGVEVGLGWSGRSVGSVVAERVGLSVGSVAVRVGGRVVSYGEFGGLVGGVARELSGLGVGVDSAVGVVMSRSLELLVAVHAVVAVGGRYVPVEVDAPAERVGFMLSTAGVGVVLVRAGDVGGGSVVSGVGGVRRVVVDCGEGVGVSVDGVVVGEGLGVGLLGEVVSGVGEVPGGAGVYTLFTSGSTGRPKGVTVSQAAVVNRLGWMQSLFGLQGRDVVLWKTPVSFDVSVWELFWPLMVGASVVVAEPGGHRDPWYVASVVERFGVSVCHFVPSMLSVFVDALGESVPQESVPQESVLQGSGLGSLRQVFCSGEALGVGAVEGLRGLVPGVRVVNLYGPTEAAVDVTSYVVSGGEVVVPIGRAVPNVSVWVLDSRLRPVPVGVVGELYLGGVQVARGYASRAGLTAERFVADPFGGVGVRLYRTGDRVRWSGVGELEYVGRVDFQVKLRGQRIELGEIETVLGTTPGVAQVVVSVMELAAGEQLVAHVTGADVDVEHLRATAEQLPAYMRPTSWVVLDTLPLNTAGKVDRKALPAPDFVAAERVLPETDAEVAITGVFADVLGLSAADSVSVTDSFFDLGGNSLAATRLAARVSRLLGVPVRVRDVFDAPTVRDLARRIQAADIAGAGTAVPDRSTAPARPSVLPLSSAQRRMWFINQYEPTVASYIIPFAFRLRGTVEVEQLRRALADVVARHEVLRTTYPVSRDGRPEQRIHDVDPENPGFDWAVADSESEALAVAAEPYDLTRDLPVRARVYVDPGTSALLAVSIHHIAADGESGRALSRDLLTAYSARRDGRSPDWPPLPLQYADHVLRAAGRADEQDEHRQWWARRLDGAPVLMDLPTSYPRPATPTMRGATVEFVIPGRVAQGIGILARAGDATAFMVLHAALAAVLGRLSGSRDVVIGTAAAGRDGDTDDLIGMFVNTVALRTPIVPAQPFTDLLRVVREVDLDALDHAGVPFDDVVDELGVAHTASHAPLVQVLLTTSDLAAPGAPDGQVAGLDVEPVAVEDNSAKLDLTLGVLTDPAEGAPWRGSLTYATDLFDDSAARRLADRFVGVLTSAVGDSTLPVGDLELLTPDEEMIPLVSGDPDPAPELLSDLLVDAARMRPTHPAVVDPGAADPEQVWTYAELDSASWHLATVLIDRGIGPEDVVVSAFPRSATAQLALWAVAKTGAVYCPIDPRYPAERIARVLDAANAVLVLTDGSVEGPAADTASTWPPRLLLDAALVADLRRRPALDPPRRNRPVTPDSSAYMIFTSGSTGTPKGVLVTHRGLAGVTTVLRDRHRSGSDARWLGISSPAFDAAMLEVLGAYGSAATLVVAPPEVYGGRELADVITTHRTTHAFLVTSVAASLPEPGRLPMTDVLVGGEAVPDTEKDRWAVHVAFHNGYGPTETTIISVTSPPIGVDEPVHLGSPVPGASAHVLDERLHPVPPGVVGELYLAGPELARGYHGRPALTAERFVAAVDGAPGTRMYRTGDLVRRDRSGGLVYVGRADFQVKLRGQRLELGEIEAVLTAHPQVRTAAVIGVGNPVTSLAGYVEPVDPGRPVEISALREHLATHLPSHMVPAALMVLDSIPRSPIGKIDRAGLPAIEPSKADAERVPPSTHTERLLAAIVGEVLGLEDVSVTADFFVIGGNSLSATRVSARAGDAFGVRVGVRDVFEAPTVRLLARRVDAAYDDASRPPPLRRVDPRPAYIPLSYAQQRIWFLNRLDPNSGAYTIPMAVRLRGRLDRGALRAAVVDLLTRHEILRTVFPAPGGEPRQHILPIDEARARLRWEDIAAPRELAYPAALVGDAAFDITSELPLRIRLFAVGGGGIDTDDHVLVVVLHHIAADGESMRPLAADLWGAYLARAEGHAPAAAAPAIQFADHALWQRETLGDIDSPESVLGRQVGYWVNRLSGIPDLLPLPTDRPRPAVASQRGGRVTAAIPTELTQRITDTARAHGATEFMVVHAALSIVLARLSATRDIVISTPVAGRGHAHLDDLVGMFVNTVVLRTDVDPRTPVGEFLERVRVDDINALARADVPFEYLVDRLSPVRSEAFAPISQVMLSVLHDQDTGTVGTDPSGSAELTFEPIEASTGTTQLDLTVAVTIRPEGAWDVEIVYATDLFDERTARTAITRLTRVLEAVVGADDMAVGAIDLTDAAERARIAELIAGPDLSVPWSTVTDAIEAAARRSPESTALVAGARSVTYREFMDRITQLAEMMSAHGVGPEVAVGVCIPRSVELVLAIHAVVMAGGSYVSIDPSSPPERVAAMVDAASIAVILTAEVSPSALSGLSVPTLVVDGNAPPGDRSGPRPELRRPCPGNALYTLFTSGSTGTPKGVTVSHGAVLNRLAWMAVRSPLRPDDAVLLKTPVTFDVSVPELFEPLMAGARLVIVEDGRHIDPAHVLAEIERHRVTSAHFVPSMMAAFVEYIGDHPRRRAALSSLRRVNASGEALPAATADAMAALVPQADLDNLYGPTEAAVEVTAYRFAPGDVIVPIGRPNANTTTWVLDDGLRPAPVGVVGELYVGGDQLARGYAARPDLTAERFVADPTGPHGGRLYRTGDLVRWNASGALEYLGRADFQVKLRGQRIELGEIETVLARVDGISHAAVTVRSGPAGDALVGYLAGRVDLDAIREHLRQALPQYMHPTQWVVLDSVPVTATGKLDRRALPAPRSEPVEMVPPADAVERAVAVVVADVLGLDEISVTTPFFDLGGNSLAAMRVVARIGEQLGTDLDVRDLFRTPTVRELAQLVTRRRVSDHPLVARPRPDRIPLSYAQQRLWFINQFDVTSPTYNMPIAFDIRGLLDVDALRAAVAAVMTRHEPLRTVYPLGDGGVPLQHILDPSVAAARLRWESAGTPEDAMALCAEGFDVTTQLPLRVVTSLVSAEGASPPVFRVVLVLHHIAGDAASLAILAAELLGGYRNGRRPEDGSIEVPEIAYADHALWQRDVLGDLDDPTSPMAAQYSFWTETLAGVPAALEIPGDRPRPPIADPTGGRLPLEIGEERSAAVAATARVHGMTPFMVCHAAFVAALARVADVRDISVGAAISGRGHAATAGLIGMFVNTVVLRTSVHSEDTVEDLLRRVRDADLAAFAHADIPFETLVEHLTPVRSTAHAPLVQVMINYLGESSGTPAVPGIGADAEPLIVDGLEVVAVEPGPPPAKVDLTLGLAERSVGAAVELVGEIDYAAALFDIETIASIRDVFLGMLDAVTGDIDMVLDEVDVTGAVDGASLILDSAGRAVPARVPGELHERTADGSLLATGMRARWVDASMTRPEILGPVERHPRVGGRRVDLDAVEAALNGVAGVVTAAVVASASDGQPTDDGVEVGAWVVVDRDGPGASDLRRELSRVLPAHCIPTVISVVDAIPVGADGRPGRREVASLMNSAGGGREDAEPAAPTGRWEVTVADAMSEITGTAVTDADQGFFDLGGTSLSAVRLVSLLRRRTGLPVEVAWIFAGPTPRDLGARLAAQATHEESTDTAEPRGQVVVPLRADGSREPVFCVHPADGLAWLFAGLTPYLDDRPVFGLQDPFVVAGDTAATSIRELAARYVAEIRAIVPQGPYHLVGWSLGGLIAQEMAAELRSQGAEVGFLGLLDSYPATGDALETGGELETDGAAARAEVSAEDARATVADLLGGWRAVIDIDAVTASDDPAAMAAAVRERVVGLGLLDGPAFDRMLQRMATSARRTVDHRPRTYDGDAMLVVAAAGEADPDSTAGRWTSFLGGRVTRVDVDADHLGIVGTDALEVIGPRIDAAIREAESRRASDGPHPLPE